MATSKTAAHAAPQYDFDNWTEEDEEKALFARIDLLVLIAAPGFETVLSWRIEQEHALRRRLDREGRPTALTMSDEAVARFIAHYERVTRHILSEMPARADVVVRLDSRRTPLTTVT